MDRVKKMIHTDYAYRSGLSGQNVTVAVMDTGIVAHQDFEDRIIYFHDFCNAGSFDIIGAHISSQTEQPSFDNPWTCVRNSETFFRMLATGQMEVASLIGHRVPYTEAPQVYKNLLKDRTQSMGVVFEWK